MEQQEPPKTEEKKDDETISPELNQLLSQHISDKGGPKDDNEKAIVDTAMKDEAAGTVPPIELADKDDGKELRYAALQEKNAEIQAAKEDIECWYFFINQIFSKLLFCNYS